MTISDKQYRLLEGHELQIPENLPPLRKVKNIKERFKRYGTSGRRKDSS